MSKMFVALMVTSLALGTAAGAFAAQSSVDAYKASVAQKYAEILMQAGPYASKSPYVQEWLKKANTTPGSHKPNPFIAVAPKGAAPSRDTQSRGGDYFAEMVRNGMQRWSPGRMPLTVCVMANSSAYGPYVTNAMNEWSAASGGKISWRPTTDPNSADIDVQFVGTGSSKESGETRKTNGPDGYIAHANVDVDTSINGKAYPSDELQKITLHELGHALGLDHSSTACDIMYWQSNWQQMCKLGQRDAATIQRLYQ